MKFRPTYAEANARVCEVLEAIISSLEWERHSQPLPSFSYTDGRDAFRRFFDVYEGVEGEDWLGIMEWAVLEEMQARGSSLTADSTAIENIVARMAGHPNIELAR